MSRKFVPLIIVLISLALIGLIIIQVIWINQGVKVREQHFNQAVYEALENVKIKLEKAHAFEYMTQHNYNEFDHLVRNFFREASPSYHSSSNAFVLDSLSGIDLEVQIDGNENGITGHIRKRIIITDSTCNDEVVIMFDSSSHLNLSAMGGSNPGQMQSSFQKYSSMFQDMAWNMMFDNRSLQEKINPELVSLFLREELNNSGIKTDFNYSVISAKPLRLVCTDYAGGRLTPEKVSNAYKTTLFTEDYFGNSGWLLVDFPKKTNYILSSMWLMLASSGLFILIILFCFIASITIIFRQKKLSDLKNDFINNMTHELKTPVATISLATEMLQKSKVTDDPTKVAAYSSLIRDENKRLSSHIEKVLQAAKIDTGDLELNKSELDVHDLINDVTAHLKLRIDQEQGTLNVNQGASDSRVICDKEHMTNVIYNLLDNAIKYKNGHLEIDITTRNKDNGILLSIADKGIGMTKDVQQKIFEKFYRVPTGNLHDTKGFGLGLNYVKNIVVAHGGTIHVESEPNQGSRFDVYIPKTTENQ